MKQLITTLLFTTFIISGAEAQLLYRISGNGLKSKSYIIGTHHLTPATFIDSISGANEAFDAVEQVCGELDMKEAMSPANMTIMAEAMLLPDGKTLHDIYSGEEIERINTLLRNTLGVDLNNDIVAAQLGHMRPTALVTQLELMQYIRSNPNYNPNALIDTHLQNEAIKHNKRVIGLETVEQQIDALYGGRTIEQERQMLLNMADNEEQSAIDMQQLTSAYTSQDIELLHSTMLSQIDEDEVALWNRLTTERNLRWVEKMPSIMAERSTLFVVGAGHLMGDSGVINLLRKEGYKVTAVD